MIAAPTKIEATTGLSHEEVDAVQNAIRPARARFKGIQDGTLLFKSIDNIDSQDSAAFQKLADEIEANLLASKDENVRSIVDRADRIGIA